MDVNDYFRKKYSLKHGIHLHMLSIGFISGLMTSLLFSTSSEPVRSKPHQQAQSTNLPSNASEITQQESLSQDIARTEQKPIFDFYTTLQNSSIVFPEKQKITAINKEQQPEKSNIHSQNTSAVKKPSSKIYTLQIASVKNKNNAEQLKKKLQDIGYKTYIKKTSHKKKQWYHIQIGPFSHLAAAEEMETHLKKHRFHPLLLYR